jgi:NDP-sugar pyrophosphorylase family protein
MVESDFSALTIVIPMAGAGSRFSKAGFVKPKPFIDVAGKTMIERVMNNLRYPGARYVLLVQRAHLEQERAIVGELERQYSVIFVPVDGLTEGAACTVLQANKELIGDSPLLVANCDQIINFALVDFIKDAKDRNLDGSILVFKDSQRSLKWSFARLDEQNLVVETREKVAISDLATAGVYFFRRSGAFVSWAIDMISRNVRVNGEFYVCPIYNYGIQRGARIGVFEIAAEAMNGIGTPEDLSQFLTRGPSA